MRKRIDRFIEDALIAFGDWFSQSEWRGKERDCVNMFAHGFLSSGIAPGAAVQELTQIRIESAVPQPSGYVNKSAPKDLVIWKDGFSTVWDEQWQARYVPWVVIEWKTKRSGRAPSQFDLHDVEWLSKFTAENPASFGYLVRVYDGPSGRILDWAKLRRGLISETNRRA